MKTKLYFLAFLCIAFNCKNQPETKSEETSTKSTIENQPDSAHNSENSLDYFGTYQGVLPCADCEGIKTELTLLKDGKLSRTVQYLGEEATSNTEKGSYSWSDDGSIITIQTTYIDAQMYQVGEHVLFYLDKSGKRIESDLAEKYMLHKINIENKKWVLTELMGQKIETNENSIDAFIKFNKVTSTVSGNNSCNTFSASYELKGMERLSLGNVAVTQMACVDMKTANAFNQVLNQTDNYTITDSVMSLNKAKMTTLAKFQFQ